MIVTLPSVKAEQTTIESAPVIVTATRHEFQDTSAPYASEVYSSDDIESSGSTTLYEFLSINTSITVMPSYGNSLAQKIDMRGYGIGDGYQNIVVTVDGHRLNNIDMVPQLLSAIPLSNIERIEITKGSGSVIYGDGATAGAIHIYTRDSIINSASITAGNFGQVSSAITTGLSEENVSLAVTVNNYHHDGYSDPDVSGQKDSADSSNLHAKLTVSPTDDLEFRVVGDRSDLSTRYPGGLTQSEFDDNPAQNSGNTYKHQQYETNNIGLGVTADINDNFTLVMDHSDEEKHSDYNTGTWVSDYDYMANDLALSFSQDTVKIITGIQTFEGARKGSSNTTSKDNSGYYVQAHYQWDDTNFSLGGRKEKVDYNYVPTTGTSLTGSHHLSGNDIGVNHRYSEALSIFVNYNRAFQAPDIDRFFNYGGAFNTFIDPAQTKTINLGVNHSMTNNKLKLTLFHVDLKNEIYYYSAGSTNTNIDESHKYGVEIQEQHTFGKNLTGSINYAYTRAIIDSEDSGNGTYNGKEVPGVPNHTATLALNYRPSSRSSYSLSHAYRSETYAANDFENSLSQKQRAFNSTDLGYSYQLKKIKLTARISNLFNHANGLWIRNDQVYPVNFTRNVQLGIKTEF